ncbi:hypothetical protein X739_32950 [Mesorhizobium sp. LNHC220B00]|nr:hypothetical protein X739_32950 [Mesorhizobium sp. LNHC220B00]
MPEFAPRGRHYDPRSDVTMAVGLLCFMLTGEAPRIIIDEYGRHPHERADAPIRAEILKDPRWPRLSQIFRIAFQQRIEAPFLDAQELARALDQVDGDQNVPDDDLDAAIRRYQEVTGSAAAREQAGAAGPMETASQELYRELNRIWTDAGLQQGGQHPTFKNGGATNEFYCVVSRRGQADPVVMLSHKIELLDGRLRATWAIGDATPPNLVFEGSFADGEGLREAVLKSARAIAGAVIGDLTEKLTPPANLKPFFQ